MDIRQQRIQQQEETIEELIAVRRILGTADGRLLRRALRRLCGADRRGWRDTPHSLAYAAGMRDAASRFEEFANLSIENLHEIHQLTLKQKEHQHARDLLD